MIVDVSRHLLHRDHVHGGEQLRDDHHDPQLPPPHGGHTRDAGLGRSGLPTGAYTVQCSDIYFKNTKKYSYYDTTIRQRFYVSSEYDLSG